MLTTDWLIDRLPAEAYVRVAVGLDALGAAPVRGTRYGAGEESAAVAIRVDQ